MSSAGQIIGGIAGAAIGFFVGSPILGAQIGMMVGSAIDPPKGPSITGPRLEDLSVQTSTYGAPLPRGYGTVCVSGNVFWLENDQLKEWTTTEESGGKGGGGGGETTTYHYSATFAVGLMHVPAGSTVSLRRLWIDTDLVYEAGSDNVESIIASNSGGGFLSGSQIWQDVGTWWLNALATGQVWTFYDGSDDQLPNARMQADKGAANVSAYPGLCYIVFEDLSLEKYSNTLLRAQVKAELVIGQGEIQQENLYNLPIPDLGTFDYRDDVCQFTIGPASANYVALKTYGNNGNFDYIKFGNIEYPNIEASGTNASGISDWGYAKGYFIATQSDIEGALTVQVANIAANTFKYRLFTRGAVESSAAYISQADLSYRGIGYVVFDRGEIIINSNGYVPYADSLGRIQSINIQTGWTKETEQFSYPGRHYASENYIFLISNKNNTSVTTIKKIARADYSTVATITYALTSPGLLYVVDDNTFYSAHQMVGGTRVLKWENGTVVNNWPLIFTSNITAEGNFCSFMVASDSPFYAIGALTTGASTSKLIELKLSHEYVPASGAPLRDIVTNECALSSIAASDIDLAGLTNSTVRGFRVAQRGAVRNSLEPLQAAYPFDVAQSGYKIRFVSRGGSSVASIPEEDLAASDGQPGVLLPVAREMDSQLPFRVSIRYTDPDREYDIGEQSVERFEKDSLNERVMELPLSLTSGEAIQMADVLLAKDWTERVEFGPFSLPPTWRHLEPADVVTVTHRGQDHTLRLTRVEYLPDGRLVCSARLTAAASYTSSATAQSPLVAGQSLVPLKGSTQGYLIDMPRIRAEQDVPGLSYGMTGLASGWPGATLLRSDDSGASYQAIGAVNARAKVFTAGAALASHPGYSIDHGSVLTVTPRYSGHTLASITEDQLYAHNNLAAYGIDGRWEIVAFKTAIDNTGSYSVGDFLRGLYGTEWATGLHAAGDYFIILDVSTLSFFGLPTNAIGAARIYRAVTQGASLDSAADMVDTYDGENLKPLSPVGLNGSRDMVNLDWSLSWQRRTRWPVELFSGQSVPLGESSESYDLEIYSAGDYGTKVRTLSGLTSASTSYSAAQQIADHGSEQSTLYLKVYQVSSVIGRGRPLQDSIYRNVPLDPYIDMVTLLMHFDDVGLTDQRGHTVTAYGNAARSATQAKFGSYSLYCDGVGDWVRTNQAADLNPFGGNFTLEFCAYYASAAGNQCLIEFGSSGTNRANISLVAGALIFYTEQGGSSGIKITGTAPPTGQWNYITLKRSGTTITLRANTTDIGTSTTAVLPTGNLAITFGASTVDTSPYTGYIDEARLTKGFARDVSAVPTAAFPNP